MTELEAKTSPEDSPHIVPENTSNNNVGEVNELREKCTSLELKLEQLTKQKDAMVVKYATGEKLVLEMRQIKEQVEKKLKEQVNENEVLQHKVQMMNSEKARICQMLDNKNYELKGAQQELEQAKTDLSALETKLKWSQNSLKTEIQLHKAAQKKLEESDDASLILLRHEKDELGAQLKQMSGQLDKVQLKQKEILDENNTLSLRIQQLERERFENQHKVNELKAILDQERQDVGELQTRSNLLDQLKLQLKSEEDKNTVCGEQIQLLKGRNSELEGDLSSCREKEAELLLFTQQLTDKNVRLQSEFTSLETKVQQFTGEMNVLKRSLKENESLNEILSRKNDEQSHRIMEEMRRVQELNVVIDQLKQDILDKECETKLLKRKFDLNLKELNKELQQCRRKIEEDSSKTSSNSSLSDVKVVQPIERQTLIEHIVKLQRISAKKSEKLDFLEEHVNSLVLELQKKSRLLQSYILRDQSGTLTSNSMDKNKANIAQLNGVMASMYSSRVVDNKLTLELSLDINRKLQAVLEDALLKNITLKESVDTLGNEIARLRKL